MDPDSSPTPSTFTRFLQLPREIRDLIYEHMLVRDIIPIECAMTRTSTSDLPNAFNYISSAYPLHAARIHRRIWPIPAFDISIDPSDRPRDRSPTIYLTYQLAKADLGSSINLNILQANHQVYTEATKVFYGSNIFSFTSDFRIPTAFAFLCDRPAASLKLITSLELALMEDNNIRGTPQAHYPAIRRSTDSLVLQYAYHWFTELCTLLSTPRIRLKRLSLVVESLAGNAGAADLGDGVKRETREWNGGEPLWLEPLLKIGGVWEIDVCWIFREPRVLRMGKTVGIMRRYMVGSEGLDGPQGEEVAQDVGTDSFKFSVLHKTEEDEAPTWVEAVLDGGEVRCPANDNQDMSKTMPSLRTQRHVECALEFYTDVYVCFCVMSCA
jgi:hypothetical protein